MNDIGTMTLTFLLEIVAVKYVDVLKQCYGDFFFFQKSIGQIWSGIKLGEEQCQQLQESILIEEHACSFIDYTIPRNLD